MAILLQDTHTSEQLKTLLSKSKDELTKTRIKILLLVKKGLLRKDIVERLSVNIDTITDVIKRYNLHGEKSLQINKGGRPEGNPVWDNTIFVKLIEKIDKQDQYWSIPKMKKWITDNHTEEIPEQTIWYRMFKMNRFSFKSARPHPYKGNKEKQDVFKKKDLQMR
jgi:transposase